MEKKLFLIIYAGLLSLAFLAQLGSIFVSLELRTTIEQAGVGAANVAEDLFHYGEDPSITAKWDEMHRYFHCCGGNNFLTGYNDFKNTPIGRNNSIPDSCCHEFHEGCGRNLFRESPETIRNKIYVNGCLTLLQDKLESDVVQMMIAYACVGVALALVELVSIALVCAFIAQINRREKRTRGYNYSKADRQAHPLSGGETDI